MKKFPRVNVPGVNATESKQARELVEQAKRNDAVTAKNKLIYARILNNLPVDHLIPGLDNRAAPQAYDHYAARTAETMRDQKAAAEAGEEYTGPVVGPRVLVQLTPKGRKLTRRQQKAKQRKYDRDQAQLAAAAVESDGSEWAAASNRSNFALAK